MHTRVVRMEKRSGGGRKRKKNRERSKNIESLDEIWKRKKEEIKKDKKREKKLLRKVKRYRDTKGKREK